MSILALVDTNVVVSGVLAGTGRSPNREIVDAMTAGTLRFVLSEALLAEYRRVLLRPALASRHRLTEHDVDALLAYLVMNALLRELAAVEVDPSVPPGDEHVVALLAAVPGCVLVTGDHRLRQAVASLHEALTPAELAARLA